MFAYCNNNPVNYADPSGQFAITLAIGAIIATGAAVGSLLGVFSAATTGGNILESAIEGGLNGAIGSVCGVFAPSPWIAFGLATLFSAAVDFSTQIVVQHFENDQVDLSKVDYKRVAKTGLQTGIGAAIPALGEGAGNPVDAFGTALTWAEASVLITCADVAITNFITSSKNHSEMTIRYRFSCIPERLLA